MNITTILVQTINSKKTICANYSAIQISSTSSTSKNYFCQRIATIKYPKLLKCQRIRYKHP